MNRTKNSISILLAFLLLFSSAAFAAEHFTPSASGNIVTVTGKVPSGQAGVPVGILVLQPGKTADEIDLDNMMESVVYFDTTFSKTGGVFRFTFTIDEEAFSGNYFIRVGSSAFLNPEETVFKYESVNEIKALIDRLKAAADFGAVNALLTEKDAGETENGTKLSLDMTFYNSEELGEEGREEVCKAIFAIRDQLDREKVVESVQTVSEAFRIGASVALFHQITKVEEAEQWLADYSDLYEIDLTKWTALSGTNKQKALEHMAKNMPFTAQTLVKGFHQGVFLANANAVLNKNDLKSCVEYFNQDGSVKVLELDLSGKYKKIDQGKLYEKLLLKKPFDSVSSFEDDFKAVLASMPNSGNDESRPAGGGSLHTGSGSTGSNVTVGQTSAPTPTPPPTRPDKFSDLNGFEWAKESIEDLFERKIISGDGSGKFYPENNTTREELVKMLVIMADVYDATAELPFNDVPKGAWFAPYIASAVQTGLVNGISSAEFGVAVNVTREDIAVLAYRTASLMRIDLPESQEAKVFSDRDSISEYAREAVTELQQAGILNGYEDASFRPKAPATRAEVAVILNGILSKAK